MHPKRWIAYVELSIIPGGYVRHSRRLVERRCTNLFHVNEAARGRQTAVLEQRELLVAGIPAAFRWLLDL